MSKDPNTLAAVATKQTAFKNARETLREEAEAWVSRKLVEYETAVEQAVITAVEDDHSVTSIARALTLNPDATPNRNLVYVIMAKHKDGPVETNYPFEWVVRKVKTAAGTKKVYDVHLNVEDFGPLDVTGEFTWRFDPLTRELDEQLGVEDPYPVGVKFYKQALDRWIIANPYPGAE